MGMGNGEAVLARDPVLVAWGMGKGRGGRGDKEKGEGSGAGELKTVGRNTMKKLRLK